MIMDFLLNQGYEFDEILDFNCAVVKGSQLEAVEACNHAPGESWHCTVKLKRGTTIVSLFRCLCCHKDGKSGHAWRGIHKSPGDMRK